MARAAGEDVVKQHIGSIALLVADYDAAIDWYTRALGFQLLEDTDMGGGKRWVMGVADGGERDTPVAGEATTPEQRDRMGDQTGGRVFLLLHTDDFWRDYERMKAAGVAFCELPREEAYGTVVVFQDLYGNKWDLLQLAF